MLTPPTPPSAPSPLPAAAPSGGLRGKLTALLRFLIPREAQGEVSRGREAWLVLVYAARRWLQVDRSATLASSLALQTLLSIVPFAGLVLTLVGLLGKESARTFLHRIADMVIPDPSRAEAITETLYQLARNVTVENLGIVGFLGSLIGASLLFITLEITVNDIWRVKYRRSAVARFTMFYTLATLAPLLIFFSLAQPIVAKITDQAGFSVVPWISTGGAFILLNRFMPATQVAWRAAAIGGLAGAGLFELGKRGFALYLSNISHYEGTYGTLAILPVFCVWAYVSWLIVLFSVEMTCVLQHLPQIRREGYVPPNLRHDPEVGVGAARSACRIVLAVCDTYDRLGTGLSARAIGTRFQIEESRLAGILDRIERAGLLLRVGAPEPLYLPGRPLDHLSVDELMQIFVSRDVDAARKDTLTTLFANLDESLHQTFGKITFHDLIREERRRRGSEPSPELADELAPELAPPDRD